ncbi:Fructose-1,6-bisphosphatase 1 [Hypsibius exemplaris]|uniref:fructose-bisphosphatase n=1 Tax=Hypsibius exemplaris TaxID=2072580 RepID=A0A1W0X5S0_HYPEX|nr:Fructose-1,6-bisphosphatase 1 [Hypsibius exemplaris]
MSANAAGDVGRQSRKIRGQHPRDQYGLDHADAIRAGGAEKRRETYATAQCHHCSGQGHFVGRPKSWLGSTIWNVREENVQGEQVKKLDEVSNELMIQHVDVELHNLSAGVGGDERAIEVDADQNGKYIVCFDPLDGSPTSTISTGKATDADALQPGRQIVAAGYAVYGSATMIVISVGNGSHGFTLDSSVGEFILSHPNMQCKERGNTYSINEVMPRSGTPRHGNTSKAKNSQDGERLWRALYVSIVADVTDLCYGGIFLYPATKDTPKGKLRLLYECNPIAFIIENAGGLATTGHGPILDVQPKSIHERTPSSWAHASTWRTCWNCIRSQRMTLDCLARFGILLGLKYILVNVIEAH